MVTLHHSPCLFWFFQSFAVTARAVLIRVGFGLPASPCFSFSLQEMFYCSFTTADGHEIFLRATEPAWRPRKPDRKKTSECQLLLA